MAAAQQRLEGLGLPRELAEHHAAQDPPLAQAVAEHCQERFADRTAPPIRNRVGYLRSALADPARHGLTRDAGGARVLPGHERRQPVEDRTARMAAERAAWQQLEAEARAAGPPPSLRELAGRKGGAP